MNRLFSLVIFLFVSVLAFGQTGPVEGDKAPDFSGVDQYGNMVDLDSALKKGPVVLFFYRGQWCPYCQRQVKLVQDSLETITKLGATVIAVVPEKQEYIESITEQTGASFPIVYDSGYVIMDKYEVTFALEEKLINRYNRVLGADLSIAHGSKEIQLPVPATYVIGKDGVILYRHYDPNYKKRASLDDIIAILQQQD